MSASTGGTAVIEDPTYNPATRATIQQTTPIAEPTSQSQSEEIIYTDAEGNLQFKDDSTRNSLIGILVVLLFVIGICFGCGVLMICYFQVTKATKIVQTV